MAKKEETTEKTGTVVRPDTSEYVAGVSGSGKKTLHNGDSVATCLNGATLDEIYPITAEALETTEKELRERYSNLNDGMQRMNLGNRLRGVVNRMNKDKDGSGDKWVKQLTSGVQSAVKERLKEAEAAAKAKAKAA